MELYAGLPSDFQTDLDCEGTHDVRTGASRPEGSGGAWRPWALWTTVACLTAAAVLVGLSGGRQPTSGSLRRDGGGAAQHLLMAFDRTNTDGLSVVSKAAFLKRSTSDGGDTGGVKAAACGRPAAGDKCHLTVSWAMRSGIYKHPAWYEGLSPQSTMPEFQSHFYKNNYARCAKPCEVPAAQPAGGAKAHGGPRLPPSLFCFILVMPAGYEQHIVAHQMSHNVGIFDCEEQAVYSNTSFKIHSAGGGHRTIETDVVAGSLEAVIMRGENGVIAANKDIFVRLWAAVASDLRPWGHDWTVKTDADAVIIPDRLRGHLRYLWKPDGTAEGTSAFLKNCKYTLYGAIEVVSYSALAAYNESSATVCSGGTAGEAIVEDRYMNECLKMLGANQVTALNVLEDARCHSPPVPAPFPCNSQQVTFHPFKTVESWSRCYDEAMSQR